MDKQPEDGLTDYPLLHQAQGGPSPDGQSLLVEGLTVDGGTVRFAISLTDIQYLVAFLLVSVGKISASQDDQRPRTGKTVGQSPPIPATSIAIGEPAGNEGYLGIAVGKAELVFAVPMSAFDELGRTLLTVSAQPNAQYKSSPH